ncbi:uncharacterized protein N7498_006111 [Penicillium cinerascens]|uniref:RGS domain-containing protein n=1 Tax=Penicillium cinerascens TaxID=70096 RepID=A0A9W9MHM1_9EURO|nr:uncharacterized protein N7498_006111 [Penicillium cinerascens]KAJ5201448.1 hypothetical protein N7498_006111 [Penicillium cinerascens]
MTVVIPNNASQPPTSPPDYIPSPSRITLENILSNHSPTPYTFNAFLDFLIHNHCVETLDFISEANAYPTIYNTYWSSPEHSVIVRDPTLVGTQWEDLMKTYIMPGSPSEINLPAYIREELLAILDVTVSPPSPEQLDSAINHAYEILIEDALIPFIRSFHLSDNPSIPSGDFPTSKLYYSNRRSSSLDWSALYDRFPNLNRADTNSSF